MSNKSRKPRGFAARSANRRREIARKGARLSTQRARLTSSPPKSCNALAITVVRKPGDAARPIALPAKRRKRRYASVNESSSIPESAGPFIQSSDRTAEEEN